MRGFKKYFRLRSYFERLRWLRIFSDIVDTTYGKNLKIHSSSIIKNSKVRDNVTINNNVKVNNCIIGSGCRILSDSYFDNTEMDDYSYVNSNSFILRAKIGKFCSIASHVYIGPGTHPINYVTTHPFTYLKAYGNFISRDNKEITDNGEKRSIIIGNDVWIGQGTLIMSNIIIGDGAIIGAHAVVTKDVEPYSIVVGTPAKIIRYRYSNETIDALMQIKWWDWGKDKIKENMEDFLQIEDFIKKHKK